MAVSLVGYRILLLEAGRGRDIDLTADDRLDAHCLACAVKINAAVHYAVIGDRERIHTELFCTRSDLLYLSGSVEQTVLSMHMQVCKCHCSSPLPTP